MGLLNDLQKSSRWLLDYASDVTSQTGEDGIVAKALSLLPSLNRWCAEFGAWDGQHLSNTFALVQRQQYNVVLIEADDRKYRQLCSAYPHKEQAIFINRYVGWSEDDSLDAIMAHHPVPPDPDLLSIDIDGNDYYVWQAVKTYRPKLVLIEYNPSIPNSVDFVQPNDSECCQGSSAAALNRLAKQKGYELIAVTPLNLLFADRQFYSCFNIPDNSLEVMRDDSGVAHLFFGYDGSVFVRHGDLAGACRLPWHGCLSPERKLQVLPRVLRRYPLNYGRLRTLAFKAFSALNLLLADPKRFLKRTVEK